MIINDILQPTHLLFILVVALLVLGPKRLPEAGRALGKGIRDFRSAISGDEDHASALPTEAPLPTQSPVSTQPPAAASPVAHPAEVTADTADPAKAANTADAADEAETANTVYPVA